MSGLAEVKAKIKQILEDAPSLLTVDYLRENETRTTEQILEQFINDYAEWIEKARKDILVILAGLEKTHVVIEREKLQNCLEKLEKLNISSFPQNYDLNHIIMELNKL